MKNINHYMIPRLTQQLYENEARSSIALSKEVANKVNEIVDAVNNLYSERLSKYQEQDGKIQGGIIYMKDNLANTLYDMLELMKSNGDFDNIIKEVIEPAIIALTEKTDSIISVKSYGATGTGIKDDTKALQDAIDYAFSHNKVVYVPAGTYNTTSTLYVYEHQQIIGEDRQNTIINYTGTGAAIELKRSPDYVFDYTEGQKIKDMTIICNNAGYGIYSELSCPYIELDNLNINTADVGIYLAAGSWLATLSNINIWKCATGIKYRASGTSTKLENIYVMYATDIAYDFEGLAYSEWSNVCADWCTGVVYKFHFCTITINGLGCECIEATNALYLNNGRLNISSAYIFALEKEDAVYIIGNGSQMSIKNSSIGANGDSKAKFCDAGVNFDLELNNCKLNNITADSSSGANQNITKFDTGRSMYHTSYGEKLSYIGKNNNDVIDSSMIDYDIPMPGIYGNVLGHVYDGVGLDTNREWKTVKQAGDIFINQAPDNGVAFFQQISDTDYHYSKGIITDITGNVITVSTMALGIAAEKRGTEISAGGKLFTLNKEGVSISSVDTTAMTITVDDASQFNVNEHFYYKVDTNFMRDVNYKAVQHVLAGTAAERPAAPAIGMQYLDLNSMKPIWWTGSRWIDATGTEA